MSVLKPVKGIYVVCWGVPYQLFAADMLVYNENVLVDKVLNYRADESAAKTIYILEKIGCGVKCVYDGASIVFIANDWSLWESYGEKKEFKYLDFIGWLETKGLR